MITFLIALVMGGIIGWLASKVMNTDAQQGVFLNVIVGCVGSMLGGWLFSFFTGGTQNLRRLRARHGDVTRVATHDLRSPALTAGP